jgi:hypothetical protein
MHTVTNARQTDAIRDLTPFVYRSYRAERTTWDSYRLKHHETTIAVLDNEGRVCYFNGAYYSQTTSGFQGRILRALSEEQQERAISLASPGRQVQLRKMLHG